MAGSARTTETEGRKPRRSFLARRWRFISLAIFLSALYVGQFWFFQKVWCTPQDLYHRVWATTQSNLFNQLALKDWPAYEHKYDQRIKNHDDAIKFANEMLATLDDPFTRLFDQREVKKQSDAHSGFYSGVGMIMNGRKKPILVRTIYQGGPAEKAGLEKGDQIMQVDDIDCMKIDVSKIGEYTRAHMGKVITFKIMRQGKPLTFEIIPVQFVAQAVITKKLTADIAYVRIVSFINSDITALIAAAFEKVKDAHALILDMRGNPGGNVNACLAAAGMMLDSGELVTVISKDEGKDYLSMRYLLTADSLKIEYDIPGKSHREENSPRPKNVWGAKPIVVLVDDGSASAAEMLAAALHDNKRATILGVRTYGKGVAQLYYEMPVSTCLSVTAARYYTPTKKWLGDGKGEGHIDKDGKMVKACAANQLHGITPDVVVQPVENLDYGCPEDNQVNAALRFLNKTTRPPLKL